MIDQRPQGSRGGPGKADTTAATNQPVRANSKFSIGSILKTFTATAVRQLVDEGKLRLSDPLSKCEPAVQNSSQITAMALDPAATRFGGIGIVILTNGHDHVDSLTIELLRDIRNLFVRT